MHSFDDTLLLYIRFCLGFSSKEASPWLKINDNYKTINVASQSGDVAKSHLNVYKELTKLRYSDSILYGDTTFYTNDTVLGFTRVKKGNPGYHIALILQKTNYFIK